MSINLETAAQLLGTSKEMLLRWARQGSISAVETQGSYFFEESNLQQWAAHRGIQLTSAADTATSVPINENSLYSFLRQGGVFFNVSGNDVKSVLQAAVKEAPLPDTVDRADVFQQLLAREKLTSTGIGNGVAIPHPRRPLGNTLNNGFISTCFLEKPIDFCSVDGNPVFVMFLMFSSDSKTHLQLLSKLSYCLNRSGFLSFLKSCTSADLFYEKVHEMDLNLVKTVP